MTDTERKEVEEYIEIAINGIKSFASYGIGANIVGTGVDNTHLQRSIVALNNIKAIYTKRPQDNNNHNEFRGIKDGECFICKESTCSLGANPSMWPIYLPHIDGQTKHRFYHIKCLYPLLTKFGKDNSGMVALDEKYKLYLIKKCRKMILEANSHIPDMESVSLLSPIKFFMDYICTRFALPAQAVRLPDLSNLIDVLERCEKSEIFLKGNDNALHFLIKQTLEEVKRLNPSMKGIL